MQTFFEQTRSFLGAVGALAHGALPADGGHLQPSRCRANPPLLRAPAAVAGGAERGGISWMA